MSTIADGEVYDSADEWRADLTDAQLAALIDEWHAPCCECGRVVDMRREPLTGVAAGFRCRSCSRRLARPRAK